jgi:hypothetical protein
VPVEWIIRRRLLGIPLREQAYTLVPGAHVAAWVAASYLLVAVMVAGPDLVVLALGTAVAACIGLVVMRVAHPTQLGELRHLADRLLGRAGAQPPVVEAAERA